MVTGETREKGHTVFWRSRVYAAQPGEETRHPGTLDGCWIAEGGCGDDGRRELEPEAKSSHVIFF